MERFGRLLSVGQPWSGSAADDPPLDHELIITTVHNPPFVLVRRLTDGAYRFDGYLVHLWKIIALELGLRYRIEPLLSGAYGSVNGNGTWSGMVGELAYGRADVALTALYLREDRASVIDYLDAVAVARSFSTFYVRAGRDGAIPPLTVSMFSSLLQPLHVSVWWAVLVSLLVLSLVLRVSLRFGSSGGHSGGSWDASTREETRRPVDAMGLGSCLLFCFTSFVGQSWSELPAGTSARLVTALCWTLRTIIYTSYTANLISNMVVHSVDLPIKSLKEFAEQPGWRLAIQPGHAILNDWRRSREQYERELYRRSVTGNGFIEINFKGDSIFEVVQPKVMTFVNFDKVVYALGYEVCNLMAMPGVPVKSKDVFMAISKRRPQLQHSINRMMLKIKETGMLSELKGRWFKSKDEMCTTSSEYQQMSLGDVLVVLLIIPFSVALCSVICAAEWLCFEISRSAALSSLIGKMPDSLFGRYC